MIKPASSRSVFARALLLAAGLASLSAAHAAPIVYTSDFIADNTRTGFNGFEAMGPLDGNLLYPGGNGPYQEAGIVVEQVNGENSTWSSFIFNGMQGTRAWYPNGGDNGYTKITLAGNADFSDVGLLVGGFGTVHYELYNSGTLVLSGSLGGLGAWNQALYLGFGGGGFDEINLSDRTGGVRDGNHNSLAIDSIEIRGAVATPEGVSTLAVLGAVFLGLCRLKRSVRRR